MTDTNDRLDALLSAAMDDELTTTEREELDRRLASSDPNEQEAASARARRSELEGVDEALRRLAAAEPMSDASIDAGLETLQARLAASRVGSRVGLRGSWKPWAWAAVAAVAAGLVWPALTTPPTTPPTTPRHDASPEPSLVESSRAVPTRDAAEALDAGALIEDETLDQLEFALGYGDEPLYLPGVSAEDFDVIDQLELLDLLSAEPGAMPVAEERG